MNFTEGDAHAWAAAWGAAVHDCAGGTDHVIELARLGLPTVGGGIQPVYVALDANGCTASYTNQPDTLVDDPHGEEGPNAAIKFRAQGEDLCVVLETLVPIRWGTEVVAQYCGQVTTHADERPGKAAASGGEDEDEYQASSPSDFLASQLSQDSSYLPAFGDHIWAAGRRKLRELNVDLRRPERRPLTPIEQADILRTSLCLMSSSVEYGLVLPAGASLELAVPGVGTIPVDAVHTPARRGRGDANGLYRPTECLVLAPGLVGQLYHNGTALLGGTREGPATVEKLHTNRHHQECQLVTAACSAFGVEFPDDGGFFFMDLGYECTKASSKQLPATPSGCWSVFVLLSLVSAGRCMWLAKAAQVRVTYGTLRQELLGGGGQPAARGRRP